MKSNRVLGVGGIVLLAAFAMGRSAQASPLSGAPLSADTFLSTVDMQGTFTQSGFLDLTDVSFETCSDDCSETEDAGATQASGDGFGTADVSYAVVASAPEPVSFVLVGLTLAMLPLIRKRRR